MIDSTQKIGNMEDYTLSIYSMFYSCPLPPKKKNKKNYVPFFQPETIRKNLSRSSPFTRSSNQLRKMMTLHTSLVVLDSSKMQASPTLSSFSCTNPFQPADTIAFLHSAPTMHLTRHFLPFVSRSIVLVPSRRKLALAKDIGTFCNQQCKFLRL